MLKKLLIELLIFGGISSSVNLVWILIEIAIHGSVRTDLAHTIMLSALSGSLYCNLRRESKHEYQP